MKDIAQKRNSTLDYIRGTAVLFMIIAHVTVFINNNQNQFLGGLARITDTLAFTVFLLVSGAVAYLAYLKENNSSQKNTALLERAGKLLLVFYIVSLVAILPELIKDFFGKIWEVLVFVKVPSYSDMLIPFIVYSLTLIPLKKFYLKLAGNFKLLLPAAIAVYFLGWVVYFLPVSGAAADYLSFFSGHADWFRFPLLQYFPVFLLGIYWGKLLQEKSGHLPEIFLRMLGSSLVFGFVTAAGLFIFTPDVDLWQRWPPAPVFLLAGMLAFSLLYLIFAYTGKRLKIPGILIYIGRHAFAFYFLHIILLYLYRHYANYEVPEVLPAAVCLLVIMGICYLCIELFQRLRGKM